MNDKFQTGFEVNRYGTNPLITLASSPTLGDNINGPSVIQAPNWLSNPLGKYYMYFAHHAGTYIRLAYADYLQGPWDIYEPGTLNLTNAEAFQHHIASPDVHVDEANQQIRMYFHGIARTKAGQWTGVANSRDGIHFSAKPDLLGKFYFRVWHWQDYWYALAKNNNEGWGEIYRSSSPEGPFELRGNFLKNMRHASVLVEDHTLRIFYTKVGAAPECIVMTSVDMRGDWSRWQATAPIVIISPEEGYEGSNYPVEPSRDGPAVDVCQLRDPYVILNESNWVLIYCGAGESAICAASINRTLVSE